MGENTATVSTETAPSDLFRDVPMSHPFAPYIYALKEYGIISGKTDSYYDINSNVSRNEVAKIFHKTFLNIGNK